MEHLSHRIWDEWTSLQPVPPVEDEIAGILDGLNCRNRGEEYEFASGRYFAVRKLMKLWSESEYQPLGSIKIIYGDKQKKRMQFSVDAGVTEMIFERISASSRKKRNWNWLRGMWGACGALYMPKTGYYLVLRPPARNDSSDRIRSIL